jgi:hypothetical protein|tara:strand:- start:156 stop:404 length:249 start_codon:yes stop_codon:yes gene_type:complete
MNKAEKKRIMEKHSQENEYRNERGIKVHLVNEVEEIVSLSKIYSKWLDRYEDVIANEIQHSDDAVDKFNEIFNPYANVEWRK